MLKIAQKFLILVVAAAFVPLNAELSQASQIHSKTNVVDSKSKSAHSESSSAKPMGSAIKPSTSKGKPIVSETTEPLSDLYEDAGTGRKRSGRRGNREHKNREKRLGGNRKDEIPSFRKVKTLESLTPVQEAKITHILKAQREKSLPFQEKLREIREASGGSDNSDAGSRRRTPESAGLRRKIHAIKKDAWLQIQKILTARQKIELEALNDSGPRRRKHPDAQPAVHDSGKSFSR